MKGKRFKDLPPELQKKIAHVVFSSLQKGNNSGAFGIELDKAMREIIGEDIGFLEADLNDIREVARRTSIFQDEIKSPVEEDYLVKHRQSKEALYQERESHLNKVKRDIGSEKVDNIVLESDKFFDDIVRRVKHLRAIVQQIDLDLKKHVRDVEDRVQFVETDRRMLYNVGEVTTHSLEAWSKDITLIHKGITESLDSIDMFKAFVPAILTEFEVHKKESGV